MTPPLDCKLLTDDPVKVTELVNLCPEEFFRNNPWSEYAHAMYLGFEHGVTGDTTAWQWKSDDLAERNIHYLLFAKSLSLFFLTFDKKMAAAGWVLSLILSSPPVYSPRNYFSR